MSNDTEWVVVQTPTSKSGAVRYYSESTTSPHGWSWTPLRERATAFASQAHAKNYLLAVFYSPDAVASVKEVEVVS